SSLHIDGTTEAGDVPTRSPNTVSIALPAVSTRIVALLVARNNMYRVGPPRTRQGAGLLPPAVPVLLMICESIEPAPTEIPPLLLSAAAMARSAIPPKGGELV